VRPRLPPPAPPHLPWPQPGAAGARGSPRTDRVDQSTMPPARRARSAWTPGGGGAEGGLLASLARRMISPHYHKQLMDDLMFLPEAWRELTANYWRARSRPKRVTMTTPPPGRAPTVRRGPQRPQIPVWGRKRDERRENHRRGTAPEGPEKLRGPLLRPIGARDGPTDGPRRVAASAIQRRRRP